MSEKRKPISLQKYILAFYFTAIIFTFGFFASDYINNRRFSEINTMKQEFQIQVLALETQLEHFQDVICADVGDDILTHELYITGEKLQFMANNMGKDHPEVIHLKKYYSLLQIRHYRLSRQLSQRCNLDFVHILYFYADQRNCPDCREQGPVLSFLREQYPLLRVYSFDYNLDLVALDVIKPPPVSDLISNESISGRDLRERDKELRETADSRLPLIIIEGKPFWGFKDIQEMKEILPERAMRDSER